MLCIGWSLKRIGYFNKTFDKHTRMCGISCGMICIGNLWNADFIWWCFYAEWSCLLWQVSRWCVLTTSRMMTEALCQWCLQYKGNVSVLTHATWILHYPNSLTCLIQLQAAFSPQDRRKHSCSLLQTLLDRICVFCLWCKYKRLVCCM